MIACLASSVKSAIRAVEQMAGWKETRYARLPTGRSDRKAVRISRSTAGMSITFTALNRSSRQP